MVSGAYFERNLETEKYLQTAKIEKIKRNLLFQSEVFHP
jgi:hypothetical protein